MSQTHVDQSEIISIEQFLDIIRTTTMCCFRQPVKFIKYDTGKEGNQKYQDLLVCEEHYKHKPFHSNIVSIVDISSIFKTPSTEWQKDLKELV